MTGQGVAHRILADAKADLEAAARVEAIWKEALVTEEPPEAPVLITIQRGVVVAPAGDHSLIIGKKKSRKTLFLLWLLQHFQGDIESQVLWFDTEQSRRHVWKIYSKVKLLTGKRINVFALRGKSPEERRNIINQALKDWHAPVKLVIVDGVRDCLSNINDADQVSEVITWQESIIMDYGVHIVNILHTNKTDNNARGHLGSELTNKAFITIELEKDEAAGCTVVKCESSRDGDFESFAFTHGEDGLPEVVSMPVKGTVLSEDDQRDRLRHVFEGGHLKRQELIDSVKTHFEVGKTRAESLVAKYQRNGWVIKNGKDRSPNTVYKLTFS